MNATNIQKEIRFQRDAKYDLLCELADAIELQDGVFSWAEIETTTKPNFKTIKMWGWLVIVCVCFWITVFCCI